MPGSPVLTRMSSRPCAGITGSNQSVTPDLFRGHRFLPAPFFSMFASRGSGIRPFIAGKCKKRVLRKPCDWLVPSAFANRGYRIKLREDVFLGCLLTDGIRKIAYLIHVRVELLHVKVGLEGRIERFGVHHQTRFERLSSVQASVATKCLHFGMTERRRRRR